ncbi:hypothetical protein EHQ12_03245 [Leptospira gomenensis]|uniref:DUF1285 domain-containing protein n=1 Tax=Leptospira gomenensis TaxID=2484974 RepID=A0A5F1Z110_9LEPT|nr:hypothetical protein [Leptospira gomenensis]TGK31073.1 hypothetical protein EHQ17_15280 [Leptospira gomenensis]TGK43277.1 hypothetical protein EHQ12_03245 [Leptospira gomenensis]TGK45208.1 hypothetical protein EHQ07_09720 [Leptospira gomenensis]TGK66122.1 hypothetical protein EHQ13_03455 [Leptospira gomenensis]
MKSSSEKKNVSPRKFDSEIIVDAQDRWIFRGNRIDQKEVLSYFRKNLKEDESGVYIDNRFGDLAENGYVRIQGYPIHLTACILSSETLYFLSESDESFPLELLDFALDENGCLFARIRDKKKIKFRLDRNCLSDLSPFLEETSEGVEIRFGETTVPIFESGESPEVPLPAAFHD